MALEGRRSASGAAGGSGLTACLAPFSSAWPLPLPLPLPPPLPLLLLLLLLPALSSAIPTVYDPYVAPTTVFQVSYVSTILQGRITITSSAKEITITVPNPPTLNRIFLLHEPILERFDLPTGVNGAALNLSQIDHITIYYNPTGAQPFPADRFDPTIVTDEQSYAARCLTCYIFFTFHLVSDARAAEALGTCQPDSHFFCANDGVSTANSSIEQGATQGAPIFEAPSEQLLPSSFVASAGTLYDTVPLVTPYDGAEYNSSTILSPLAIPEVGNIWVSSIFPAYFTPTLVKATNYYLTASGQVLGVGQVISTTYFQVLSNPNTQIAYPNSPGFFDVPSNYTATGGFPSTPITSIRGREENAVFTFGFKLAKVSADPLIGAESGDDTTSGVNENESSNSATSSTQLSSTFLLISIFGCTLLLYLFHQ